MVAVEVVSVAVDSVRVIVAVVSKGVVDVGPDTVAVVSVGVTVVVSVTDTVAVLSVGVGPATKN